MKPPVHVVDSLIKAYPDALLREDQGVIEHDSFEPVRASALGLACRTGASADVVRLIVRETLRMQSVRGKKRTFSQFVKQGIFRTTAFCGDAAESRGGESRMSIGTLKVLLEEYPEGVMDTAIDNYATLHGTSECYLGRAIMRMSIDEWFWEMFEVALMAFSLGTIKESERNGRNFLALHALIEFVCTSDKGLRYLDCNDGYVLHDEVLIDQVILLLEALKVRNPEQFREKDHIGRLPLHVALSGKLSYRDSMRNTEGFQKIVSFLLKEHPQSAAILDASGMFPLHLAASKGIDCVDILFDAEARAVESRCPNSHLYPFQLAVAGLNNQKAKQIESEKTHAVDLAFRLLLHSPTMAHGLSKVREPWMDSSLYKDIQVKQMRIALMTGKLQKMKKDLEVIKTGQKEMRLNDSS
eukprot:CAMPEP_0113549074 /NCGR_PEP_ID=MMETSP0015_2-20120614/13237_1 /TAXON_ID=2838 /ORGANISM="Odontella" /LENGTH=411 /DNA_ID=CAMNT_0000449755 /DNA_START=316 /DNA_END=1551 /DNA_ORIENTATION=+ /assembly_acc=CAM_ASM_000160